LLAITLPRRGRRGAKLALQSGVNSSVLIVEDEQCIRDILVELFEHEETHTHAVATLAEAQHALRHHSYDLIVTDIRLGGQRDGGLQVMAAAGMLSPDATVVALTAFPDDDNRNASGRLGATHFLEKPVDLATIAALATQCGVATAMTPRTAFVPRVAGGDDGGAATHDEAAARGGAALERAAHGGT
jgi:CheY-like chemotaxis protein